MNLEENKKKEVESKSPIKSLRTYQGDVEEALLTTKASTTTILVAEQKRKEKNLASFRKESDSVLRNKFFIIIGSILLGLGVITITAVYYIRYTEKTTIIRETKTLITFSKEKDLGVVSSTRAELLGDIVTEKKLFELPVNSVLYLNIVDPEGEPAPIEKVLTLIAPKIPPSLARSFEDKYMFGVYSFDTNEVFIILTLKDYATSYGGMLRWERDMPVDLGKIFGINQTESLDTSPFVDETLKNKDLRIMKDKNGKIVLLYSFIDRNTVIITANERILTAVVDKYLINKTVQ